MVVFIADRLLGLDFEREIHTILHSTPKDRITFLFSATMTSRVEKLQRASLKSPVRVQVAEKYSTVDTLLQYFILAPAKYKDLYLVYLLNEFSGSSVLIFVEQCVNCQKIAIMLHNLGMKALPLHGKMEQDARIAAFTKFRDGKRKILVATDVASRGLDIPAVDIVVNYDIPVSAKTYIHRVGRTARAGRAGKAFCLVTQYDVEFYQKIEKTLEKEFDKFPAEKGIVMTLLPRVEEAKRIARIRVKERGGKRKRNIFDDDDEADDGILDSEKALQFMIKGAGRKRKRGNR